MKCSRIAEDLFTTASTILKADKVIVPMVFLNTSDGIAIIDAEELASNDGALKMAFITALAKVFLQKKITVFWLVMEAWFYKTETGLSREELQEKYERLKLENKRDSALIILEVEKHKVNGMYAFYKEIDGKIVIGDRENFDDATVVETLYAALQRNMVEPQ